MGQLTNLSPEQQIYPASQRQLNQHYTQTPISNCKILLLVVPLILAVNPRLVEYSLSDFEVQPDLMEASSRWL